MRVDSHQVLSAEFRSARKDDCVKEGPCKVSYSHSLNLVPCGISSSLIGSNVDVYR